MRSRCTIAAAVLLAACGEEDPVARIADFEARSPRVACRALEGPRPAAGFVTQLRAASESTFVLVDERARQVAVLDAEARRIGTVELGGEGSDGIARPADAALVGDTLLVVADAGLQRLRAWGPDGAERWTLDLAFPPQRIAVAGQRMLIAAVGMDARIPSLLFELHGAVLKPLPVPFAPHPDALARMLMNAVTLDGFPDGRAVVAHQYVLPRAWRIESGGSVARVPMPVAERSAASVGAVPPMPLRDEDFERMAVPVIAATADPATGGLIYLTRSGARAGGHLEKALIRADSTLSYVSSFRLPMNATALVLLPGSADSVIVVDDDQHWYRCPVPARAE